MKNMVKGTLLLEFFIIEQIVLLMTGLKRQEECYVFYYLLGVDDAIID